MSTFEPKSLPSIWTWDDPRLPIQGLKTRWVEGQGLSADEIKALRENRDHNPDIRIREECRSLLCAADPSSAVSGIASLLRRKANTHRIRTLVVKLP